MTKYIRLRETLSGGRADGRPWPVAGGVIEVADWEYDHCVNAGWAEHADPPEPEKATKPVKVQDPVKAVPARAEAAAAEPEPARWQDEFGGSDPSAPEPEPAAVRSFLAEDELPEPPRPSDPKQDWIAYAVAADPAMSEDKATAMSKADLMSRYGGRL